MSATCRRRRRTWPLRGASNRTLHRGVRRRRCMFESNFPPDKQSCGYTELWNAFKRITAGASAAEKKRCNKCHRREGVPPIAP